MRLKEKRPLFCRFSFKCWFIWCATVHKKRNNRKRLEKLIPVSQDLDEINFRVSDTRAGKRVYDCVISVPVAAIRRDVAPAVSQGQRFCANVQTLDKRALEVRMKKQSPHNNKIKTCPLSLNRSDNWFSIGISAATSLYSDKKSGKQRIS